jgi:hypothetical protein
MRTSTIIASAAALVGFAAAQTAVITIEASHCGAGCDLTNTTITVPIGFAYNGDEALKAVSSMYLVGSYGVPVDSVSCTPYVSLDGTGNGLSFNSTYVRRISTNTDVIGSVVCISTVSGSKV